MTLFEYMRRFAFRMSKSSAANQPLFAGHGMPPLPCFTSEIGSPRQGA